LILIAEKTTTSKTFCGKLNKILTLLKSHHEHGLFIAAIAFVEQKVKLYPAQPASFSSMEVRLG